MTETEGTAGGASSSGGSGASSGGPATKPRRRSTGARRKPAAGARKTAPRAKKTATARRPAAAGSRKTATRRRRRAAKNAGLQTILDDLAKRANRAGVTIADLSEKGADAARGTIDQVGKRSRQTIARVRREWDKLDTARKAQFVAGLLAALAATAAGVAKASRK
jgi:hypothetical protein